MRHTLAAIVEPIENRDPIRLFDRDGNSTLVPPPKGPLRLYLLHVPARHFALIPKREYNLPDGLVQHRIMRRRDAA